MKIRRNADGRQNLNDLRAEIQRRSDVRVERRGSDWVILRSGEGCWHESPCPFHYGERAAIQHALFGQPESEHETQRHNHAWTIRVVVWAGAVQREYYAATYEGAMDLVDMHHRNAHDPQFFDREGNRLYDVGFALAPAAE